MLLFADDAVLVSETAKGLQNMLNSIETYCNKWNRTVNTDKTKIMVFQKGGRVSQDQEWKYAGDAIEIVSSFNYLGIVLSSGGSYVPATKVLKDKALKAIYSLLNITKGREIPVNIMLNLFDSYVLSILSYSSEVWGYIRAESIEILHKKFCKWIINVKRSTNSLALYAELGRYPLYIMRYVRMIKYWLKLYGVKYGNSFIMTIVNMQREEIVENENVMNWSARVRNILCTAGFFDVWLFPQSVNVNMFISLLTVRLKDIYISEWLSGVRDSTSLNLYKEIKTTVVRSPYLTLLENSKHRNIIAKIRLSSHNLLIETGRHRQIERVNRKCSLCNRNDLEDEFHFILICPFYMSLRSKYIARHYTERPSMYKLIELLNSENKSTLTKLAIFCIKGLMLRNGAVYIDG